MADTSKIEWTDATWNPITGCTLVSDGCRHCYAATLAATRLKHHPSREGLARINAAGEAKFTGEVRFNEQWLDQPLRWRKPRMIFVCAHGDLFHESVPDEWIDRVFAVMALSPRHTFQVLTKRPERAQSYLARLTERGPADTLAAVAGADHGEEADPWVANFINGWSRPVELQDDNPADGTVPRWPLPNVWLGVSIEDQATADARIPHLLATPAAVRFVSAEPTLGPLDLTAITAERGSLRPYRANVDALRGACQSHDHRSDDWFRLASHLDWIIVGGESGPHARPMHPDWARSLRDQCQAAGVAFFFKQWGEWGPVTIDQDPDDGTIGPAYPVRDCTSEWSAHHGEKECLFWQGLDLVHWPHIETFPAHGARRIGKKRAGRLLDGREWNEMPEAGHG